MTRVLANHLQIVTSDLIVSEKKYPVKRISIQNNSYLVCKIMEKIEDNNEAAVINVDQTKAFDWLDGLAFYIMIPRQWF